MLLVEIKVNLVESPGQGCCARISNWILGVDPEGTDGEKHHREMEEHVQKLSTLTQSRTQQV